MTPPLSKGSDHLKAKSKQTESLSSFYDIVRILLDISMDL